MLHDDLFQGRFAIETTKRSLNRGIYRVSNNYRLIIIRRSIRKLNTDQHRDVEERKTARMKSEKS